MGISKIIKALYFHNKKWLPIIDESGTVSGKINYNQSINNKNEYLLPIIRIALIHNKKLFLVEKKNIEADNKPCLDYPFERLVFHKETIEEAVEKTIKSTHSKSDLNHNCIYLFHYIHQSEKIRRLVFFYVCHIHDDSLLKKINLNNGKWWTREQIKENLNTNLFSAFLKDEFQFLDSTVLAVK